MATSSIDRFDDAWKYVLEKMFPEFLAFYFPAVAEVIDWEAGWDFLNQELQQVHPDAELGRRAVDRLVRVRRRGGAPEMLYVHVEVQSQPDGAFGERMFTYFYRLFDRFRQPVTSLAVLADDRPGWRPDRFELHAPGTRSLLEWSTVKLLDYARHPAPGDDDNPFAWVTRAHLATLHTRGRFRRSAPCARLPTSPPCTPGGAGGSASGRSTGSCAGRSRTAGIRYVSSACCGRWTS